MTAYPTKAALIEALEASAMTPMSMRELLA